MKYGLIAGGGSFPLLTLKSAINSGHEMVVVAVKEEATPELEDLAAVCHWISLGQLSKLISILRSEGISQAVMVGRIQHKQIYSSLRPDWRLLKLLNSLRRKNTDSLLGAVAQVLEEEGITLLDSTFFLAPLLARVGPNTNRKPTTQESRDIEYGREVAAALSRYDIGQSVVICEQACVALEAMEGTDAILLRAGELANGRKLTLVKSAKLQQDMRFDVPIIGPGTIRKMKQVNATAVSVDAKKTLLLNRDELLQDADDAGITIVGSA